MTRCSTKKSPLLGTGEPPPFAIENRQGQSEFVILCEHAQNRIPAALNNLGLGHADLQRHIAWDIGALAVGRLMAQYLDAALIYQRYSRLVIDCNRRLSHPDLIVDESDGTLVTGNQHLSDAERQVRTDAIWRPYQEGIGRFLDDRRHKTAPTILFMLHSFTPVFGGHKRPWDVGLLCHRLTDQADAMAECLRLQDSKLVIGRNEPYRIDLEEDYTLPEFGESRCLPHVFIEIRQDHIGSSAGQKKWAKIMTAACLCLKNQTWSNHPHD